MAVSRRAESNQRAGGDHSPPSTIEGASSTMPDTSDSESVPEGMYEVGKRRSVRRVKCRRHAVTEEVVEAKVERKRKGRVVWVGLTKAYRFI